MADYSQKQAKLLLSGFVLISCVGLAFVLWLVLRGQGQATAEGTQITVVDQSTGEIIVIDEGQIGEPLPGGQVPGVVTPGEETIEDFAGGLPLLEPIVQPDGFTFYNDGFHWYPVSDQHGPTNYSETNSSGFAQTEQGAALAAIHLQNRTGPFVKGNWEQAIAQQTIGEAGKAERILLGNEALASVNPVEFALKSAPVGWDVVSYTNTDARFLIYFGYPMVQLEARVVWRNGDWLLVIPPEGHLPGDVVAEGTTPVGQYFEGVFE